MLVEKNPSGAPEPALSLSKGLALFEIWDSTVASISRFWPGDPF
jgi:hypothetical protein